MELQSQLERVQMDLLAERANGQQKDQDRINQLESQEASLLQQIMEATNQQAHEGRIQEATEESEGFLDDIDIAGVPIAESGMSGLAFGILKSKTQAKYVAKVEAMSKLLIEQQTKSQQEIKAVTDRAIQAESVVNQLQTDNKGLEVANYQLGLDNDALGIKVTKGAEMLAEATITIEEQNTVIEEYKKKELQGYSAPQKVVLTTNEQVAQQEAQLRASQIPVTYMKADPNDFTSKVWNIITVIPEESRSIHYFEKGLYRLVDAEEAEQLRADYASKKAEIEQSIPVLAVPDINPVNETVEATPQIPFHESNQMETAVVGLADSISADDRESVEKESEVITLESLDARLKALESKVAA